ncbi:MAG TPA: hypothetical protein GX730_05400 [Chloroflexi bacterium]|nr:hypothetical protein [Chloroflexota bacterium]
MKKWSVLFPFFLSFALVLPACDVTPPAEMVQTQTSTPTQAQSIPTATPTPTLIGALSPDVLDPPSKLTGELEVRFPHPWGGQPEFCESFVPYELNLEDGIYDLSGEGNFECLQSETLGAGITQFLEQYYKIALAGSMDSTPGSPLKVDLRMTGNQKSYFELPPEVPPMISAEDPFNLEIDQALAMKFKYEDGSNCLWNKNGTFCSLDGEQGLSEQSGWLFILHPDK